MFFRTKDEGGWCLLQEMSPPPPPPAPGSQNMAQSGIIIVPSDAERIGHTVPLTGVTMFQVLTSPSGRSARILDRDVAAFNHFSAGRNIKWWAVCDRMVRSCVR